MGGWESREEEEGKKEIERKMEGNLEWEIGRGGGGGERKDKDGRVEGGGGGRGVMVVMVVVIAVMGWRCEQWW